jgi:hypothetical protein
MHFCIGWNYCANHRITAAPATLSGGNRCEYSSNGTTWLILQKQELSVRMQILPGPKPEACIRTGLAILVIIMNVQLSEIGAYGARSHMG